MIVAAILMSLAAQPQAAADCGAAASRGPDFMSIMSGDKKAPKGSTMQDKIGGTITDPPAHPVDLMVGAMPVNKKFEAYPVDLPKAETKEDAEMQARMEAAGICNGGKHPA